jgi:hypothetical protein
MQSDYTLCKLEKRDWVNKKGESGSDYALHNTTRKTTEFGGHEFSGGVTKKGEKFGNSKEYTVFYWSKKMSDDQYQEFVDEYGDEVYCHIPTETFLSVKEYKDLGLDATVSNAIQPQSS